MFFLVNFCNFTRKKRKLLKDFFWKTVPKLPHLDAGVMEVVRTKQDFHKVLLSRLISRQIWLINVVNGHPSTYLTKLEKQNPDLVTES